MAAMSSFFTLPASQKKRKRTQVSGGSNATSAKPSKKGALRDESISGSDVSDDELPNGDDFAGSGSEDDEDLRNEDPAAKRIRLALSVHGSSHLHRTRLCIAPYAGRMLEDAIYTAALAMKVSICVSIVPCEGCIVLVTGGKYGRHISLRYALDT